MGNGNWGPRRERGIYTPSASAAEKLAAALAAQDAACAKVGAVLADGYGRVTTGLIALCVIDPTGVDQYTGAPAVRRDMDAAIARVSEAVKAAAEEAQIVDYDGSLRITGAGGASVLDQFPPLSDKASERTNAEEARA